MPKFPELHHVRIIRKEHKLAHIFIDDWEAHGVFSYTLQDDVESLPTIHLDITVGSIVIEDDSTPGDKRGLPD